MGGVGVAKDEVFSAAIASQTKRAAVKALRGNAEAADWRCGARDYGRMRACACAPVHVFPPDRSDLDAKHPQMLSSGGGGMSLGLRPAGGCARGRARVHRGPSLPLAAPRFFFFFRPELNLCCLAQWKQRGRKKRRALALQRGRYLAFCLQLPPKNVAPSALTTCLKKGTNKRTEHLASHDVPTSAVCDITKG